MWTKSILIAAILSIAAPGARGAAMRADEDKPLGRTIQVPYDHEHPAAGSFGLYYELGRPFDRRKPTVFVVADGQQFYVRAGAMRGLQDSIFGDGFNVVGVVGRGANDALLGRVREHGAVDWRAAWRVLKSAQWVEDLERVRKAVVGSTGRIALYGRSGGGLLVHQYLSAHPDHVSTVFTQAAVNRFIDAELGLNSDTFWSDIGDADPALRTSLLDRLARHPAERARIMLLLQRQNFFVPADSIQQARRALIRAIHDWDEAALAGYGKTYQVDQVLPMLDTPNPATSVRLFELFAPVLVSRPHDGESRVDPDLEVGRLFSAPLMQLLAEGRIPVPAMDLTALHRVSADVYLLAGRFDHTADYRSQIALASHYPKHRLLLLADDHDFLALEKTGLNPQLVQAALRGGIDGPRNAGVEQKLSALVYREY
jgi:pimeloyl-ACP methyl ester carboxylesterase